MIIDLITFNGEYDMLELRLQLLDKYVDRFIIAEAPTTFTSKPKPLYFMNCKDRYAPWFDKITYFPINENYTDDEIRQATNSPNTQGAAHWTREFLQKESLKKALKGLKDEDIVVLGDVDEIWELPKEIKEPLKLKIKVYAYYVDFRSNEQFWGPVVATYKMIKDECLNHLRTGAKKTEKEYGWHFTSLGGIDELRRKLNDSYTDESYNTDDVQANLAGRFGVSDYIGRDFKFKVDASELPKYLIDNKEKYAQLFTPSNSI